MAARIEEPLEVDAAELDATIEMMIAVLADSVRVARSTLDDNLHRDGGVFGKEHIRSRMCFVDFSDMIT